MSVCYSGKSKKLWKGVLFSNLSHTYSDFFKFNEVIVTFLVSCLVLKNHEERNDFYYCYVFYIMFEAADCSHNKEKLR